MKSLNRRAEIKYTYQEKNGIEEERGRMRVKFQPYQDGGENGGTGPCRDGICQV